MRHRVAVISPERVLGFRLRGHHLHRRTRSRDEAVAACGVRTSPPGSAAAALAARVAGPVDTAGLVEVMGPRLVPMLVPAADVPVFTAGALPAGAASLRAALGDRAADTLGDS